MPESPILQPLKHSFTPRLSSRIPRLPTLILGSLVLVLAGCGGSGGGLGTGGSTPGGGAGAGGGSTFTMGYIDAGNTFNEGTIGSSGDGTVEPGERVTLTVDIIDQNQAAPDSAFTVTFSSNCVNQGLAQFGSVTQVSARRSTVEYTNVNCDGTDTITASVTATSLSASLSFTVIGPDVLTLVHAGSTFDQLALAGIGGNESSEVTFTVSGPGGVPVVGETVNFSISSAVGGANIQPGRETAVTDSKGEVTTIINSGTVAGPVNVRATHAASGRTGLSSDIIISTGVPEASRFSISYTPFNPLGAFNTDGVTVDISIIASDAFGNNPTDGTRVTFVSPEAGNVTNSCLLVDAGCTVTWRSTSTRPADMRVEVLAYTDGAEEFVDNNGNSVYDAADGAIFDLGEPYADENEDGNYDVGEYFFDTNQDGVRNGPNGLWDGPCLDQVDSSAVCTGNDTVSIYDSVTIVMPSNSPRFTLGTFPTFGSTITVTQGGSVSFSGLVMFDSNASADAVGSNPMPVGTTLTFAPDGAGIEIQGVDTYTVPGNVTGPTGTYGVTVTAAEVDPADPLPTNTRLTMSVEVPGQNEIQYSWPVSVQR